MIISTVSTRPDCCCASMRRSTRTLRCIRWCVSSSAAAS
jgi:hypothetical protein